MSSEFVKRDWLTSKEKLEQLETENEKLRQENANLRSEMNAALKMYQQLKEEHQKIKERINNRYT